MPISALDNVIGYVGFYATLEKWLRTLGLKVGTYQQQIDNEFVIGWKELNEKAFGAVGTR